MKTVKSYQPSAGGCTTEEYLTKFLDRVSQINILEKQAKSLGFTLVKKKAGKGRKRDVRAMATIAKEMFDSGKSVREIKRILGETSPLVNRALLLVGIPTKETTTETIRRVHHLGLSVEELATTLGITAPSVIKAYLQIRCEEYVKGGDSDHWYPNGRRPTFFYTKDIYEYYSGVIKLKQDA